MVLQTGRFYAARIRINPADEFIFRFANNAPDESAVFNGQVFDTNDDPIANATVYIGWNEGDYWNTSLTETDAEGFLKLRD